MVGRGVSSRRHEARPVLQTGLVLIMGPAAKLDVVDVVRPTPRVRGSMVKLDLPLGIASVAFAVGERASPIVPLEHLPAGSGGDGTRFSAALLPARSRLLGECCFLLFRFGQQRVQCSIEDHSRVAVPDLVTQKILELNELVSSFLSNRDLELVAPWRKGDGPGLSLCRDHDRAAGFWERRACMRRFD